MTSPGSRPRNDRIDALKFFAIALVVFGHVADLPAYGPALGQALYVVRAINMPLFMFLAGYVLFGREGSSPGRFVGRKFVALMVPYFVWVAFDLVKTGAAPARWLSTLGLAAVNPHAPGFKWFLYVLFVFYVLFTLVRVIGKQDLLLVLAAAGTIALTFLPGADVLGRLNVQWLFAFFIAGYLGARHRDSLPTPSWALATGAAAAFATLLAMGLRPDYGSGWPPWFIGRALGFFTAWWQLATPAFLLWKYATAFAGITAVVAAYSLVDPRWLEWQAFVGRRSLGIYVTQGWLLVLAVGTSVSAALGSAVLVLFVALAVAMLLEQTAVTRVLFLGQPAKRRPTKVVGADSSKAA